MVPPKQHASGQKKRHKIRNQRYSALKTRRRNALRTLWPNGSPMSVSAREWQYKDSVNDSDGLMSENLSEDWQTYLSEGGESLAL